MSDMPAPDPDQPLVRSIKQMYEDGNLEGISDLRDQQVEGAKNPEKALAAFEATRAEAYARYQADHESSESARVKAAKAQTQAANDAAPASDDVENLYTPIVVEPNMSPDGSFVESVKISRWEVDPETNTPVLVEEDVQPS